MAPRVGPPKILNVSKSHSQLFYGWYVWTCPYCGEKGQGIHSMRRLALKDWRWHRETRCQK